MEEAQGIKPKTHTNQSFSNCPRHTPLYNTRDGDKMTVRVTVQLHTSLYNTSRDGDKMTIWVTVQYTHCCTTDEIMGAKCRFELLSSTHTAVQQMRSWGLNVGLSYCPIHTPLYTERRRDGGKMTVWLSYCSRHAILQHKRSWGQRKWRFELLSNTHADLQQMRSWRLNSGLSYCPIIHIAPTTYRRDGGNGNDGLSYCPIHTPLYSRWYHWG